VAGPLFLRALIEQARTAHALGDLRGAVRAWQQLLSLEPKSWQTLNDLGSVLTKQATCPISERQFERSLCQRVPNSWS